MYVVAAMLDDYRSLQGGPVYKLYMNVKMIILREAP